MSSVQCRWGEDGSNIVFFILMVYTDGGPDHRVNFLSVQLWYIAIFLARDLDCLIAVRTPPYNSWKNPAERVMSELNLVLQGVQHILFHDRMNPQSIQVSR